MTAMLTRLTINGVTVYDSSGTNYLVGAAKFKDGAKNIIKSTVIAITKAVDSVLTLTQGQAVVFTRGTATSTDATIFRGIVGDIVQKSGYYEVTVYDKIWDTVNRLVTKTWNLTDTEAGVWSEIFTTIVNDYTNLTCDGTTITSSATYPTVERFVAQEDSAFQLLNQIAFILGWSWGFDHATNKVWLAPPGTSLYPTTLTVGTNVINSPAFLNDFTFFFNKLTLIGDYQVCEATELFSGDGSEDEFTLTSTPYQVKVEEDVGGTWTERKGGTKDMISGIDYYVDKDNKKIIFVDNIPAAGASNVRITYSYKSPIKITGQDDASIAAYTPGSSIDIRLVHLDLRTVDDAVLRHNQLLSKFSTPMVRTEVIVTPTDITTQNKVTIYDAKKGVTHTLDVVEVEYSCPYYPDKLTLGFHPFDLNWFGVETATRVKILQDQVMGQVDLNNIAISRTIPINFIISQWATYGETKYDTFVLDVSPLDGSKTWTTEADWDRGTYVNATGAGGTLTISV